MDHKLDDLLDSLRSSPEVLREKTERTPQCPDVETFSRFAGGELKGAEQRRVRRHVLECNRCYSALKSIRPYATPVRDHPVQAPAKLTKRALGRPWKPLALASSMASCAVAVFVFLVLPEPGLHMQLRVDKRMVRSGGILGNGDQFHLEVTSSADGYVFVYAWNAQDGGQFIYPEPHQAEANAIRKGQVRHLPAEDRPWTVTVTAPGAEETLFLLFSAKPVSRSRLDALSQSLDAAKQTQAHIDHELEKHFRVEQKLSYVGR